MFAPTNQYLDQISWDPETASFWNEFRTAGFDLNAQELALFRASGFVVSERFTARDATMPVDDSFADLFYNVWFKDLPVLITTDAILQAWHRSYDAILAEVEESFLSRSLNLMLEGMASRMPEVWSDAGAGVLQESILDADFYLTVARSLLRGAPVTSTLDQDQRVAKPSPRSKVTSFSKQASLAHDGLARYFQCSTWLGRIDLMIAGGRVRRCDGLEESIRPRETGTAIVLWDLLHRSGQFRRWLDVDKVLQSFVGWSDSMGFGHLSGLLAEAGIRSVNDVPDLATLEGLQSAVLAGDLGLQNIRTDYYVAPLGAGKSQLPRAFLFLGQRFVPDSWALSQTVFDNITWVDNGISWKVSRRVPSALDVPSPFLGTITRSRSWSPA